MKCEHQSAHGAFCLAYLGKANLLDLQIVEGVAHRPEGDKLSNAHMVASKVSRSVNNRIAGKVK